MHSVWLKNRKVKTRYSGGLYRLKLRAFNHSASACKLTIKSSYEQITAGNIQQENKRMRDELNRGKNPLIDEPQSKKDEIIKQLKYQISALNIRLTNYGLTIDSVDKKEIERMKEENRLHAWKLQIAQLNDVVHRLRETNNRLIYQINKEKCDERSNKDA